MSGWPSYFSDRHKNTNLVENVEILLPVKCCGISFSGFRGKVKNVSVNQRPERPCCFTDRPEKHKLRRRRWDIASCQVSLNSVQRRSRKCFSQSEAGRPSCFSDRPEKHKLDSGRCDLASGQVKFCWIPFSGFRGELKTSQPIRAQGRPSCFSDWQKNQNKLGTNVEDVRILLSVKFR